jgi:hypothetical protein
MILAPGTFVVSDYRKNIPAGVKIDALLRFIARHYDDIGELPEIVNVPASGMQFDHRPPLQDRPFDTEAGDFMPRQHDPEYIEPLTKPDHLHRTTGRKPGAERTVTTRGSDVGEAARTRSIRDSSIVHQAKRALKNGDRIAAGDLLSQLSPKGRSRLKKRRGLMGRGFDKGHRPMRSRNTLRRGN